MKTLHIWANSKTSKQSCENKICFVWLRDKTVKVRGNSTKRGFTKNWSGKSVSSTGNLNIYKRKAIILFKSNVNVFMFLIRLRFPKNLLLIQVIHKRYGNPVVKLVRKFEKLDFKHRKPALDLQFLKTWSRI